jgi:YHS domain-containing protein
MKSCQRFVVAVIGVTFCLIVVARSSAVASPDSPVPAVNASEGIGLKGYDPAAYFVNGRPTKGAEQYSFAWKGATYRFASEENLNRFKADLGEIYSAVWRLLCICDVAQPNGRHRSVAMGGRGTENYI